MSEAKVQTISPEQVPVVTPEMAQGILALLSRTTLSPGEINSYMLIQHTLQQIVDSGE